MDERTDDKSIGDSCRHSLLKSYRSPEGDVPTGDSAFRTVRRVEPVNKYGMVKICSSDKWQSCWER